MEPQNRVRAFLYLDDGQPESRDQDCNYVPLGQTTPRHWLSVLFRLRAWRAAAAAAADRDWLAPERPDIADRREHRLDG
jgi:hypothetical protein